MIALRQAGLAYDARPVFVDADLEIAAGEVVVIAGPAGAGATALIELVTGQRVATSAATPVAARAASASTKRAVPSPSWWLVG